MQYMIDPPSGWMYGFPKMWDKDKDKSIREWLIDNDYPQQLIDELGDSFFVRTWKVQ